MSAMKNANTHRQKLHSPYQGAVAKLRVYMFFIRNGKGAFFK